MCGEGRVLLEVLLAASKKAIAKTGLMSKLQNRNSVQDILALEKADIPFESHILKENKMNIFMRHNTDFQTTTHSYFFLLFIYIIIVIIVIIIVIIIIIIYCVDADVLCTSLKNSIEN